MTWYTVDRICGKRLKAVLCNLVNAMERHGHLNLDPEIRKQLLKASAATIDRRLRHPAVDDQTKEKFQLERMQLDPVKSLHRIREGQVALAALISTDGSPQGPGRESLDQFLAQFPQLWQAGEVLPTHRARSTKPRHWRTRKDPFEDVLYDVLCWLQRDPDATAKALFDRLQREYPGLFPDGQLRTLQRRVQE